MGLATYWTRFFGELSGCLIAIPVLFAVVIGMQRLVIVSTAPANPPQKAGFETTESTETRLTSALKHAKATSGRSQVKTKCRITGPAGRQRSLRMPALVIL